MAILSRPRPARLGGFSRRALHSPIRTATPHGRTPTTQLSLAHHNGLGTPSSSLLTGAALTHPNATLRNRLFAGGLGGGGFGGGDLGGPSGSNGSHGLGGPTGPGTPLAPTRPGGNSMGLRGLGLVSLPVAISLLVAACSKSDEPTPTISISDGVGDPSLDASNNDATAGDAAGADAVQGDSSGDSVDAVGAEADAVVDADVAVDAQANDIDDDADGVTDDIAKSDAENGVDIADDAVDSIDAVDALSADTTNTIDGGPDASPPLVVPAGAAFNTSLKGNTLLQMNTTDFVAQCIYLHEVTTDVLGTPETIPFTPSVFAAPANSKISATFEALVPPAEADKTIQPPYVNNQLVFTYQPNSLEFLGLAVWNATADDGLAVKVVYEPTDAAAGTQEKVHLQFTNSAGLFANYSYPQTFPGALAPACPEI